MSLRLPGMLLCCVTALIAVLGAWGGTPLLSTLWCLPAGLLLAALAYESHVVQGSGLQMRLVDPDRWYLGRPGTMGIELRHSLRRPMTVEIVPAGPPAFVADAGIRCLTVAPSRPARLAVDFVPRSLGGHDWPPLVTRVRGALGVACWPRTFRVACEVRVGPDLLRERSGAPGVSTGGARGGRTQGAGAELRQLRPYQPGDSLRVIDWKATARAQRLMSREFTEDQHLEIILLIDAGRASGLLSGELDRFGHYVNAAARLAQLAASLDDRVGLVLFADRPLLELKPARGAAAVARIRAALAAARIERAESNPLHAAARARSLARHRSLVIILTDLDDTAVTGQLADAVRLLRAAHLPFIAGLSSASAEAMMDAPARRWSDPYRALAAQDYCRGLDRKVQALAALGAPALIARPEQLDRAVFDAYASFRRRRRV